MAKKDYIKMKVMAFMDSWECPPLWHKFAHYVELFILDAFVDMFITLCILVNTTFMAMDHAGMSKELAFVLSIGNYVCMIHIVDKLSKIL